MNKTAKAGCSPLESISTRAPINSGPVKRVWIEKPGSAEKRPLGIPTVTDRVVQAAVGMVIEPIFENRFAKHSYGFRPGRGCKEALRRVEKLFFEMVRYADDMVVLCHTEEEAKAALDKLREWMAAASITSAGPTATARSSGSFACWTPEKLNSRASVTEQTADWRAGCGRSASPVWRGERGESPFLPLSVARAFCYFNIGIWYAPSMIWPKRVQIVDLAITAQPSGDRVVPDTSPIQL